MNEVVELYAIFQELQSTTSRNEKEAILKEYKDHELFRFTLKFLYDPYIVTGLSKKKINKKVKAFPIESSNYDFDNIKQVMSYLTVNNSGKDYDIYVVQNFINKLPTKELKDFAKKIFTKSLKVGITEKTINKVYGKGTIPSFSVMLAESYAEKEKKVKGKFYITLKLDGNRCVALKENNNVKFYTRKGQPIEGMVDLEEEFKDLPSGYAYDGELLLVNKDNLPSDELFRKTQTVVRKDGIKKDLEFHLFDIVPIDEFKAGKSKNTYEHRRNQLESIVSFAETKRRQEFEYVKVLPVLYCGEDKQMISVLMKWVEENKYEGLMLNTADGLYEAKRTDALLKIKKFKTADLLCMGLKEGTGQFEGMLGAILVEYKGNLVEVGSGFTIEDRKFFWENKDEITGKIVEVQYFEESKNKNGGTSLRFPVFRCVRHDKTVDDIRYE